MSLGPFFRTPFTDLTGCLINHQTHSRCGVLEMKMMDCLEAYGMDRGTKKCKVLIEDFQECAGMKKQTDRIYAMRIERQRQWLKKERKDEEHYAPPPQVDAY